MSRFTQAACYESGNETQRDAGIKLIDKLEITKGSTVLDLGCGTGLLAKVLSERVGPEGRVVAVDPDEERLKIAREKYSANNIEYIQADDKTFPAGQYDLIFCNVVIHWIPDKESLFKRVYMNLHPGAQFTFTTSDGEIAIPAIGRRFFDEVVGPDFLQQLFSEVCMYPTAVECKTLASATGFEQTSVITTDVHPEWRNLDHYIDVMHGWFGGEFDPSQFDRDALTKLKEEYGDGPVVQTNPIKQLSAILTKPI